ncbi:MAG: nuclear transport factor 2 family protein [Acidobacteriales bacterium]|nr:nuclear transport factor 2 family protein [Terriglobales bacterium]
MKTARIIALAGCAALAAVATGQATKNRAQSPESRLQIFFTELENQGLLAVQERNEGALNRLFADQFRVRVPATASDTSREEWIRNVFGRRLQSFQVHEMTVDPVSADVSVAGFLLTETFEQPGAPLTETHFIVDVWANTGGGDHWRCVHRYSVDAPSLQRANTAAPAGKK